MRSLDDKNENARYAPVFLFILCAVYVVLFCWLGFYAWPQTDIYAYSNAVTENGFWPFQKMYYT